MWSSFSIKSYSNWSSLPVAAAEENLPQHDAATITTTFSSRKGVFRVM